MIFIGTSHTLDEAFAGTDGINRQGLQQAPNYNNHQQQRQNTNVGNHANQKRNGHPQQQNLSDSQQEQQFRLQQQKMNEKVQERQKNFWRGIYFKIQINSLLE